MRKLACFGIAVFTLIAADAACAATETVLHAFDHTVDGAAPSQLVAGDDGNLYGVVQTSTGSGVFKLTPAGQLTRLASFGGNVAVLSKGITGNLFGVTNAPGDSGRPATLFRLTPAGVLSTLHAFTDADDIGAVLTLVQASNGRIYGTASPASAPSGGRLFQFNIANGTWSTLHDFSDADGSVPRALIQAADGLLYGGTSYGGPSTNGTLFRASTTGTFAVLDNIGVDTLMQAADGNFYATWENVFAGETDNISGFITRIASDASASTVASFANYGLDVPHRLVQGVDGNLYTATTHGGASVSDAALIRMTLAGKVARVHSLGYAAGGAAGKSWPLVLAKDGNLYGVSSAGGASNDGTVFRLDNPGADVVNFTPFVTSNALLQDQTCKTARVLDGNNVPKPNVAVTFLRSGANPASAATATTDASGIATYCWIGAHSGLDSVTARIVGFDDHTQVRWNLRPTLLAADGYVKVISATQLQLQPRARLTDSRTGAPIAGRVVRFSSYTGVAGNCPGDPYSINTCYVDNGGDMCSGTTDASGYASCKTTVADHLDVIVAKGYTALFDGDSLYGATSAAGALH